MRPWKFLIDETLDINRKDKRKMKTLEVHKKDKKKMKP